MKLEGRNLLHRKLMNTQFLCLKFKKRNLVCSELQKRRNLFCMKLEKTQRCVLKVEKDESFVSAVKKHAISVFKAKSDPILCV